MAAFDFSDIFSKRPTKIDYDRVRDYHALTPKRICFNSTHSNSLRTVDFDTASWALFIPFNESIELIFKEETNLAVWKTKKGTYWCPMKTQDEYDKAMAFKEKYKEVVFLRDTLDISIALAENFDEDEERTHIGELEYQAKSHYDGEAAEEIVELCVKFIKETPFYKDCEYICAVPASKVGEDNLPIIIADEIAKKLQITSLCKKINWNKNKEGLKNLSFDERWPLLEGTGLSIDWKDKEKSIILIDDLYQSGTTMQFVAMKLKEAGFRKVYGLSIVKSRRNNDNT